MKPRVIASKPKTSSLPRPDHQVEVAKYSIEEGTVCLLASGSKAVDAPG